jgi:glycosyltransferase involved in cell wall biosynthesis
MKPKLLCLSPGPWFAMPGETYTKLSEKFTGRIITTSRIPEILRLKKVGDFSWHCFYLSRNYYFISRFFFIVRTIFLCVKLRLKNDKIDLVITYDPLSTGVTGMICAFLLQSKFAPEVNGVYTSPSEYLQNEHSFSTKLKKLLYPKIEKFVLSNAAGIKLLYPTQIAPFNDILGGKIVRSFSCYVDIQSFVCANSTDAHNEILFVGFPFKRKGVDILIAAFKLIADKFPNWKLKILGWFSNQTELNEAIDGHPQIYHHKPVMPAEMPLHIGACSILVLPSRSEAMGRVLVEAMAAGKPRVGANVDGIPTVINDGIDGLLFKSEDALDLASKLESLMSSQELRNRMGTRGKERALKEFSSTAYFNNLFAFYDEVLNPK